MSYVLVNKVLSNEVNGTVAQQAPLRRMMPTPLLPAGVASATMVFAETSKAYKSYNAGAQSCEPYAKSCCAST